MDSSAFNKMGEQIAVGFIVVVVVSMAAGAAIVKAGEWLLNHVSVSIH